MDKEPLIRLATPASITLLAISIISIPIIARANVNDAYSSYHNALKVYHVNSCN